MKNVTTIVYWAQNLRGEGVVQILRGAIRGTDFEGERATDIEGQWYMWLWCDGGNHKVTKRLSVQPVFDSLFQQKGTTEKLSELLVLSFEAKLDLSYELTVNLCEFGIKCDQNFMRWTQNRCVFFSNGHCRCIKFIYLSEIKTESQL